MTMRHPPIKQFSSQAGTGVIHVLLCREARQACRRSSGWWFPQGNL